jgi:ribosomal protein S4
MCVVIVINEHGKNVEALCRALPGKSIAQCRNFFTNYKRKLNLPRLIAEYELKHGQKISRYSRQAAEQLRSEQEALTVHHQYSSQSLSIDQQDDLDDYQVELTSKRPRITDYSLMDDSEYV